MLAVVIVTNTIQKLNEENRKLIEQFENLEKNKNEEINKILEEKQKLENEKDELQKKLEAKATVNTKVASVRSTVMSAEQWRPLVAKYPWDTEKVLRIMTCESKGDPARVNDNPRTKDYSVGLMQINLYGKLASTRPSEEWLKVPENNLDYAYNNLFVYQGYAPWTCARKV